MEVFAFEREIRMAEYHKYVFDLEKRQFVGDFENMYQREAVDCFDSWHQEDLRNLSKKIVLSMLDNYCFQTVVDLGCGKGSLTHLFKKSNNKVVGYDVSPTAVKIAHSRFPDIKFEVLDLQNRADLVESLDKVIYEGSSIDLIISMEVLSYIENWKNVLQILGKKTDYALLCLYLPPDPIGFVKNENEFVDEFEANFELIECIHMKQSRFTILFGKRIS